MNISPSFSSITLFLAFSLCISTQAFSQVDTGTTDGDPIASPMKPSAVVAPAQSFTFSGTIPSGAPTMSARLNRNAVSSTCETPKICNIFTTGTFLYSEQNFTNPSSEPVCVEIIVSAICTEGNLALAIYDGVFAPSDICANYLADPGSSAGIPADDIMLTYELAPFQTIVIVVSDINQSTCDQGGGYEIAINGEFPAAVPTLSQWGLIILSLTFMIFGVVMIRRSFFSVVRKSV